MCVYMGSYIFPYIQKCLEILSDQFKIASSTPVVAVIRCSKETKNEDYNAIISFCHVFVLSSIF